MRDSLATRQDNSVSAANRRLNDSVSACLLSLNVSYPAQSMKFSASEAKILKSVWMDVFKDVDADVLTEAVMRFIANDRKGFFPAPGQIMGYVDEIISWSGFFNDEK